MSFKDYSATPSAVTTIGDAIYVGPNMARDQVRPALQQLAADGRQLWNIAESGDTWFYTSQAAGEAATSAGDVFRHPDERGRIIYRERTSTGSTVIAVSDQGASYPTLAALADGGDTAAHLDNAFLAESGKEGVFVFSTADLSAAVELDTGKVRYIAKASDPTGATGAWVRQEAEGRLSLAASTAAALESLAKVFPTLTGYAGDEHVVETAPYLIRDNLGIDLKGATLRNTNATALATSDIPNVALPLGASTFASDDLLTFHTVSAVAGTKITVGAGIGASYAPGDNVLLVGTAKYMAGSFNVFRNWLRARVVSVAGDVIKIDRAPSSQMAADTPLKIANASAGTGSGVTGVPEFYYLYRAHIHNGTIKSDLGEAMKWGGMIDSHLHDLRIVGRNAIAFNAMQDCLIENIHFESFRKICEIAQGSAGTIVRNMRGTLDLWSDHSDIGAPPFFIAINENCAEITLEGFNVSSGVNVPSGNACQIGAGRDNVIRDSILRFPAATGTGLSLQSNATSSNVDSGYKNVTLYIPAPSVFLNIGDVGGGVIRPLVHDLKCFGTPTARAANLSGIDGELYNNRYESGGVLCVGTMTGWRIDRNIIPGTFTFPATFTNNGVVGNYIRDGFANLTTALLKTNDIRDNESDASRALNAVAVIDNAQTADITTTTANAPKWSMVCPAGTLTAGDRILGSGRLLSGGTGGGNRSVAVGVSTPTGGRKGCGSAVVTAVGSLNVEFELTVQSDTSIIYRTSIGNVESGPSSVTVDSLAANALTITIEAWIGGGTEAIIPYGARIIPIKPGMKHLSVQ